MFGYLVVSVEAFSGWGSQIVAAGSTMNGDVILQGVDECRGYSV